MDRKSSKSIFWFQKLKLNFRKKNEIPTFRERKVVEVAKVVHSITTSRLAKVYYQQHNFYQEYASTIPSVTIDSHRVAIGILYLRLGQHKYNSPLVTTRRSCCSSDWKRLGFFLRLLFCTILLPKLYMNLNYGSVRAPKLTQEGIESNPGSRNYAIKKAVQELRHQGNFKYGE